MGDDQKNWVLGFVDAMRSLHAEWAPEDKQDVDRVRDGLKSVDRERLEFIAALAIKSYAMCVQTSVRHKITSERLNRTCGRLELDLDIERHLQPARTRRELARSGANAKLAGDPKQAAKAEAFKLWQERRAGKHSNLRTNEQFAMECMQRWRVLTSPSVITSWCTEWTKQAKRKSQSAS